MNSTVHPEENSVAVIGGGVNGAALALRLAQQGKQVTLLEALPRDYFPSDLFAEVEGPAGHSLTASSVANQTSRSLRYSWERLDHELEAVQATRDLMLEVQGHFPTQRFLAGHPSVMLIHPEDAEMGEAMRLQAARVAKSGASMEYWDGADAVGKLHQTFPAMENYPLPAGTQVVMEAGYDAEQNPKGVSMMVNPAAYLRALHSLLREMPNVQVEYDARVEHLQAAGEKDAAVTVNGQTRHFAHAAVAAGGWSRDLLAGVEGLAPRVKETPKRVHYTHVIPADAAVEAPLLPFIQPESLKGQLPDIPYKTTMPATVRGGRVLGVKLLDSEKIPLPGGADDLRNFPISPEETAADMAAFAHLRGGELPAEAQRKVAEGGQSFRCMITATPDKSITAGLLKMADGTPSPLSALSACSYATFVLGGAAVNALAAEIDGREPPYRDWVANHSPHRDPALSERAKLARVEEVTQSFSGHSR